MKKFVLFLMVTFSCLILLDWALALLFDHLYSKMKTGQTGGKINYYLSLPVRPQLVIMGSSRALYQVIPDSFNIPSFNLSHAGMHQVFHTGLLSILEQEKRMPPSILLHIEPEEFTGEQRNRDIQNLKYYYGKNDLVTKYISSLSAFEGFKFNSRLYRYNGRAITLTKNYIQSKRLKTHYNGYEAIESSERDSLNTLYSLSHEMNHIELPVNKDQLNYLLEFINICRRNNTHLICFTSPRFKNSSQEIRASFVLDSLLNQNKIEYINYSVQPITVLENNPRLWKDVHHLNHDGAQIESGALAKSVLEILNRGSQTDR